MYSLKKGLMPHIVFGKRTGYIIFGQIFICILDYRIRPSANRSLPQFKQWSARSSKKNIVHSNTQYDGTPISILYTAGLINVGGRQK